MNYFTRYIGPLLEHFADAVNVEMGIHPDVMFFTVFRDGGLAIDTISIREGTGGADVFAVVDAAGGIVGEFDTLADLLAYMDGGKAA